MRLTGTKACGLCDARGFPVQPLLVPQKQLDIQLIMEFIHSHTPSVLGAEY